MVMITTTQQSSMTNLKPEWTPWHEKHANKIELVAGVDCWIWVGATGSRGYGRVKYGDKSDLAHRAAFIESGGRFGAGNIVRHLCGNRYCVRPGHLAAGTSADNGKDTALMFNTTSRLVESDVRSIRSMYRDGVSLAKISARYRIAYGTVFPIVNGKSFAHIAKELITQKGSRSQRKLTQTDVEAIRRMLTEGVSQPTIAATFGVKPNTISRIKTGARWPEKRAA